MSLSFSGVSSGSSDHVGAPLRLQITISGRSTEHNFFEKGEPIELGALVTNVSTSVVLIDPCPTAGMVSVSIETPLGQETTIDLYEQTRAAYGRRLGGLHRVEGREAPRELAPGQAIDLCKLVIVWHGVSASLDCTLSGDLVSAPGEYTVRASFQQREAEQAPTGKGGSGKLQSRPQKIRILGEADLARLEARFPVSRRVAFETARSAAIQSFRDEARISVSEPIRLRMQNDAAWYDVAFMYDDGLTASWLRVTVDATTGESTVTPFGQGA